MEVVAFCLGYADFGAYLVTFLRNEGYYFVSVHFNVTRVRARRREYPILALYAAHSKVCFRGATRLVNFTARRVSRFRILCDFRYFNVALVRFYFNGGFIFVGVRDRFRLVTRYLSYVVIYGPLLRILRLLRLYFNAFLVVPRAQDLYSWLFFFSLGFLPISIGSASSTRRYTLSHLWIIR